LCFVLKTQSLILAHLCNPTTWEAEVEYGEFEVSLGYIARPYLKRKDSAKIFSQIVNYLLGLALHLDPPDLSFPSSYDYRGEPLVPGW
jgi:hypothetical protein